MRRRILITSAMVFVVSSIIPSVSFGCLHQIRVEFGLLFPWFAFDVRYGPPAQLGVYARGPVEQIEAFHLYWSLLPFALGAALVVGTTAVGVAKGLTRAARYLKRHTGRKHIEPSSGATAASPLR